MSRLEIICHANRVLVKIVSCVDQVPGDIDTDIKIDKLSTFLSTFLPYRVLIEGESPLSRYKRYIKDDRYEK